MSWSSSGESIVRYPLSLNVLYVPSFDRNFVPSPPIVIALSLLSSYMLVVMSASVMFFSAARLLLVSSSEWYVCGERDMVIFDVLVAYDRI